jgi:hypothetical protein
MLVLASREHQPTNIVGEMMARLGIDRITTTGSAACNCVAALWVMSIQEGLP